MRCLTDLLILLTTVIIMTDSQVRPPGPTGILHKLVWKVRLLEGQEGTTLINFTTCALSDPCVVFFRYCLGSGNSSLRAHHPSLLWPSQRSLIQCVWLNTTDLE
jgi:hypothetical protein